MQFFIPEQANTLTSSLVNKNNGNAITTGTVNFYLIDVNGSTNAGKWYNGTTGTWSDTEVSAGLGTHKGGGSWFLELAATVWTSGVQYKFYAKESADLNVPVPEDGFCITATSISAISGLSAINMASWLETEFLPLTLATPTSTIQQLISNAIRYWNTNSGYKISSVVSAPSGTVRVQLNAQYKTVVQVYPTYTSEWILNDHPMWSLLGITILDNVTTDLIMMSESFKNYRQYVGTNFRWHWERPTDPTEGGYLYLENIPSNNQSVFVVGTKRILSGEEIVDDYILDWILNYSKALLKMVEGNTLRKASIINVRNDGSDLVSEGKEEKAYLEEKLRKDAKWVVLARRF